MNLNEKLKVCVHVFYFALEICIFLIQSGLGLIVYNLLQFCPQFKTAISIKYALKILITVIKVDKVNKLLVFGI